MNLGPEVCRSLDEMLRREWLETDGLGNFASGTVSGINTRRYHGLLTAEGDAAFGRRLLCAKVEEALFGGSRRYELSANQYADTVHPQGYRYLDSFRLDPWPVWTWRLDCAVVEKHVLMPHETAATLVVYRIVSADGPVALEVRPLVAGRDYHSTAFENWSFRRQADSYDSTLEMMPYDEGSRVCFRFPRGAFQGDGFWFYNFVYAAETARGLDDREDLFNPGLIMYKLHEGDTAALLIGSAPLPEFDAALIMAEERARRAAVVAHDPPGSLTGALALAADAFRIMRGGRPTIIAGYPWFEVRQREVYLAMPGLALGTGELAQARDLLAAGAGHLGAPPLYGDREAVGADVPLWYAWAARHYLQASADTEFGQQVLRPALAGYLARVLDGAVPGVRLADDGLLATSLPGTPLTWMDGWLGDWVVTPREGKAVEINALWYLLLRFLEELGQPEADAAAQAQASFRARFWSAERGWLLDVVDGPEGDDAALRPNQILAVSLHDDLLSDDLARSVTDTVGARLLTPYGLRTLAPEDSRYHGRYEGGPRQRDEAYHQGTVWTWLLGPYGDAVLRCYPDGQQRVAKLLEPFSAHLADYGLGQIAQLFDGDAPHEPRGGVAHASSVAALLRLSRRIA